MELQLRYFSVYKLPFQSFQPPSAIRFPTVSSGEFPPIFSASCLPSLLYLPKVAKMRVFMLFGVLKNAGNKQSVGLVCDYDPTLNSCTCQERRNPFLHTKPPKAKSETWFSQLVQYRRRQRLLKTSRNDYDDGTPAVFGTYEPNRGLSTPHRSAVRPSVDWQRHRDSRGGAVEVVEVREGWEEEVRVW